MVTICDHLRFATHYRANALSGLTDRCATGGIALGLHRVTTAGDGTMIDVRSIAGLLAGVLVATAAYAEASGSASKPAKAAKPAAQGSGNIDLKRDVNQAWSEMRRVPQEIGKGVPAAGREAGNAFKGGWNKARDGFTGKAPPMIPDPPK